MCPHTDTPRLQPVRLAPPLSLGYMTVSPRLVGVSTVGLNLSSFFVRKRSGACLRGRWCLRLSEDNFTLVDVPFFLSQRCAERHMCIWTPQVDTTFCPFSQRYPFASAGLRNSVLGRSFSLLCPSCLGVGSHQSSTSLCSSSWQCVSVSHVPFLLVSLF